ncbi:MAG TPA: transketolase [Candidatus Acidoferrum sp.]|nr:transketolase [Candidatus Acidoferrum sp.]
MTETSLRLGESAALARHIRVQTARMIHRAKSSHLGSSYSMADLLAVLYGRILRIDPKQPEAAERDRFVLSKGHACAALYAVLAERGFFPKEWLEDFYQDGARLAGHATHLGVPGVEVSTGSLGHGLPIACGMALAGKRDGCGYRVFAMLSDGECDEGSTWEAALFAGHHGLDNLIAIVDYNKIQSLGTVNEVLNLEPFAEKWRAFGWGVQEIDGHDFARIEQTLASVPVVANKPTCVVAHTVKGKGVSFMENKVLWHYRSPDREEMSKAMVELGAEE